MSKQETTNTRTKTAYVEDYYSNVPNLAKDTDALIAQYLVPDKDMDALFAAFSEKHQDSDDYENMEEFAKQMDTDEISSNGFTGNSDNSLLDSTLGYITFGRDDKEYIMLQINYSKQIYGDFDTPKIFMSNDMDGFIGGMSQIYCVCKCGSTYYSNMGCSGHDYFDDGYPARWKPGNDTIMCTVCNTTVKLY